MTAAFAMSHTTDPTPQSGARLVATDGRVLPLAGTTLTAEAAGGIARVVLEQHFKNPYAEPLSVTYSLPLPADGAVSGFAFRVGGRRIVGEIDKKKKARERYEQALVEGRSAALLEQDRSSLFTQEIGNIPPGEEIVAEVIVDQRLRWLDEGAWEWRFPTVVAPRYLGEPGRVPDAARVAQEVADGPIGARVGMRCVIRDAIPEGRRPESPSHAVESAQRNEGIVVTLREGAALDRDLVVRWRAAAPAVGLSLEVGRPGPGRGAERAGYGLLTVIPPASEASYRPVHRDMIVLLDTSGSMSGEPLAQAVRVVSALVDTLREDDQLEMIEFSSRARRWKSAPVRATAAARREAIGWLGALRASGGTEMREGIFEALSGLRENAQRQVVLVTDGQIGFESQVVEAIQSRLPGASRLHTVGVGSAVNRSLTGPAARAGRGVEVVIGLGEDPEGAAWRIVSRTRAPLVVNLEIEGRGVVDHAPARLPDLFAGAPALVGVALRPEGGEITVRGRMAGGVLWEQHLQIPVMAPGEGNQAVAALYGREHVEDLEMRLAAGEGRRAIDRAIEQAGLDFQISTRLTSWVAVTQEVTVDAGAPLRRERMPHALPHGMSAEGLGLRPARAQAAAGAPGVRLASMASISMDGANEDLANADEVVLPSSAPVGEGVFGWKPPEEWMARPSASAAPMSARPAARQRIAPRAAMGPGAPPAPPKPREVPTGAPPPFSASTPTAAPSAAPPPASRGETPPAPAPKKEYKLGFGIVDRVKRLFTGEEQPEQPAAPPAEPVEEEKKKKKAPAKEEARKKAAAKEEVAAGGRRELRGRVVVQKEDALVVEVTVEGAALDWAPEGSVTLVLADGSTVRVSLMSSLSTRAGQIAPGQSARICVSLRGELAAAPSMLFLRCGGQDIAVRL